MNVMKLLALMTGQARHINIEKISRQMAGIDGGEKIFVQLVGVR